MIINIEELHKTIERESEWRFMPRATGRTFAMILQAVQSADLLSDEYSTVVVVSEYQAQCSFHQMLAGDIARALDIKYTSTHTDNKTRVGNCTILFLPRTQITSRLRGVKVSSLYIDHFTKKLTDKEVMFLTERFD